MDVKMTPPAATSRGEADVKMTPPPANEIELFCGVYGSVEDPLIVKARLDERVESVRVELGNQLGVQPKDLRLYLAKKKGGNWVKADEELESFLARGPVKNESGGSVFNRMWRTNLLSEYFGQQTPPLGVVHVLVELTENLKRQKTSSEAPLNLTDLKASKSGDLPKDGDFLELFDWNDKDYGKVKDIHAIGDIVGFTGPEFYVRKEIICVLENFKEFLHVKLGKTTEKFPNEQFIFMGSPGTGKSCILALICFYLAIKKNVPVVWHRVAGVGGPVTRLFHQGKYYEWVDRKGDIYLAIYDSRSVGEFDPASCWFCLDGLNQEQLARTNFGTAFTLLATSGQFNKKGEGGLVQATCLLPYWRQEDLEDLAEKMNMGNAADRYFVSGGSVRFFVNPIEKSRMNVTSALRRVSTADADVLLTPVGSGSKQQIDSLRGIGILNVSDPKQYTDPDYWKALVTSKMVMEYLVKLTKPDYFQKFLVVAKDLKDPRLQGVVLEQLFHSYVRNQESVGISYMKYDNQNRNTHRDPGHDRMRDDMGSVKFGRSTELGEPLIVKREGKTLDAFVGVMKRWAKDPDEMDYLIPAFSTCETIDAVAKWEFKSKTGVVVKRFCLLQLTMADKHKCEASVLSKFAQPFLSEGEQVCYMALLCGDDEDKGDKNAEQQKKITRMEKFRLDPVVIKSKEDDRFPSFPLYVASYALL